MGTISERLAPLAEKLVLVEPLSNLAAVLRAKFRDDPKVEVAEVSLEQHTATIGDGAVDTVVIVNVLEHIQITPPLRQVCPRPMVLIGTKTR
jgi:hypothetical protein